MPKTKIICTIGPASDNVTVLRKMMLAGMDVARLNFSHGTHAQHAKRLYALRQLNKKYRRRIMILQDLEGHRVRVGALQEGKPLELKKRQVVYLTNKKVTGTNYLIPFDYEGSLKDIKTGTYVFIDDGNIALRIVGREKKLLKAEVMVGGLLKERKGINMPQVQLKFKGITEKDRQDLEFAVAHRVEYVAQSFVRGRRDLEPLRELLSSCLRKCKIIAKIENREGIRNIDEILKVSDGIMIARGDMGVSIPVYQIPIVQKEIIRKCNRAKKLVITATQMLESMVENIRPTRAEVTDVANAILDGTDFVMLSAETAAGKYPSQAIEMMNEIIKFTEQSRLYAALGKPCARPAF